MDNWIMNLVLFVLCLGCTIASIKMAKKSKVKTWMFFPLVSGAMTVLLFILTILQMLEAFNA